MILINRGVCIAEIQYPSFFCDEIRTLFSYYSLNSHDLSCWERERESLPTWFPSEGIPYALPFISFIRSSFKLMNNRIAIRTYDVT